MAQARVWKRKTCVQSGKPFTYGRLKPERERRCIINRNMGGTKTTIGISPYLGKTQQLLAGRNVFGTSL